MKYACPCCESKLIRNKYVVYMNGRSEYSGISSRMGISIGRRRTSAWLGGLSYSGTRQTLLAKNSAPPSIFPPILLVLFIIFISKMAALVFVGIWVLFALKKSEDYEKQWICLRCGVIFIPNE